MFQIEPLSEGRTSGKLLHIIHIHYNISATPRESCNKCIAHKFQYNRKYFTLNLNWEKSCEVDSSRHISSPKHAWAGNNDAESQIHEPRYKN